MAVSLPLPLSLSSLCLSLSLSRYQMVREQLFTLQKENEDFPIVQSMWKKEREKKEKNPRHKIISAYSEVMVKGYGLLK